jgi:hypothetical protein
LPLNFQKYGGFGIRDPRSGNRKKTIPDPGPRVQKGTRSRIRIRNTVRYPAYLYVYYQDMAVCEADDGKWRDDEVFF